MPFDAEVGEYFMRENYYNTVNLLRVYEFTVMDLLQVPKPLQGKLVTPLPPTAGGLHHWPEGLTRVCVVPLTALRANIAAGLFHGRSRQCNGELHDRGCADARSILQHPWEDWCHWKGSQDRCRPRAFSLWRCHRTILWSTCNTSYCQLTILTPLPSSSNTFSGNNCSGAAIESTVKRLKSSPLNLL